MRTLLREVLIPLGIIALFLLALILGAALAGPS
jgi:hypothetical protein